MLLCPDLVLEPDGAVRANVAVELRDGRIAALHDASAVLHDADAIRLSGRLLAPGCVNAHSHAFQRGLRGRVERAAPGEDDFWTWRREMYDAAGALDPDSVRSVTEACYREARAAGFTATGEFHYVHHQPDGTPYAEPNALALAVVEAARAAGMRLVVLLAAYARAGAGRPPERGQRRFCDDNVWAYLRRVEALAEAVAHDPLVQVGYAPHSVRAVPRDWLEAIGGHARSTGFVVHVHACEQPREIEECKAEHGIRPIELLDECGLLGERTTVVHATHASARELDLLAENGATVCACPTTEGNLGDGSLPAEELWLRRVPVAMGSDSNVRLDPFEEVRETETLARRQAGRRNVLVRPGDSGPAAGLWECLWDHGARALGIPAPAIAPHAPADLMALDLTHPAIADVAPADLPAAILFSGSADLVRETWVAGRPA